MQYIADRMPVPLETRPIDRRTARASVFAQLRRWIEDGVLEPGEVIRDGEIAARLGVSRTPVREALQALEQHGAVETLPGRSTRVTSITREDVALLYAPLAALHGLAAEIGTPYATTTDIDAMSEDNERLSAALDADDPLAARDADGDFHTILLRLAANPYLDAAIEPLLLHARRLEALYFRGVALGRKSYDDHQRIIEAVTAGDTKAARDLTTQNFARFWTPPHGNRAASVNSMGQMLPAIPAWHANVRSPELAPSPPDPRPVHRLLPGYSPTPLLQSRRLAEELGVKRVWVKDESSRLGLPSFKILGASYALARAMSARLERADAECWDSFTSWSEAARMLAPLTLVAATDGNHGHAVAHLARLLCLRAHVLVPASTAPARIESIRGEGARVDIVAGTYDDAVAEQAALADRHHLVLSDTSWPGYELVPSWVIDGYETIFCEIDAQLADAGANLPDLVIVQAGVGALATAAVRHWRAVSGGPRIITAEPSDAACVLAALIDGKPRLIRGPHRSIMAGLNCGLVSEVALPTLLRGLDGALAVTDAHARAAVTLMRAAGFAPGATGAVGVAAMLALNASAPGVRTELDLDQIDDLLVICTEGITDPQEVAGL